MEKITIKYKVKIAWWFTYIYLPLFEFMCTFIINYIDIDFEPNYEKLERALSKAIKYNVID